MLLKSLVYFSSLVLSFYCTVRRLYQSLVLFVGVHVPDAKHLEHVALNFGLYKCFLVFVNLLQEVDVVVFVTAKFECSPN